jgi:subtilisin-like proprotein convertase family protein
MRSNPLPVACLALLLSTPLLFAQAKPTSPRLAESLSAVELVANSSLNPANEEASKQFDETFSKPIQINDGRKRSYVLAVDELYQPTPDGVGQIVPIKESSKPSTLASVANILAKEKNQETRLILYPVGAPHNDQTRHILSHDVVVKTDNREAAIQAAAEAGLRLKSEPAYAKGFLIFSSETPTQAIESTIKMRSEGMTNTRPLFLSRGQPEFLPDDPYFKDEWYIRGRGQNGAKKASDAKITPVWEQRDSSGNLIRGTGITVGIVDNGVQMDHPDLAANISATYKINFNDGASDDPSPGAADNHGTAVAGVAAAVGFNGIGVTGAAPSAKIAPIRLIGGSFTSLDEADAYAYGGSGIRIKSNSWSRQTGVNSLQPDDEIVQAALATAANAGTVITFSGGNDLTKEANTNQRGLKNSIYTLPIAAVNDQARQCDYSNPGASLIISAPAGGDVYGLSSSRPQGTSTTDRTGTAGYNIGAVNIYGKPDYSNNDYTENFNGTSSATPVVSGVTALVLQANPSLNWRDVKEIYIRSATKNDSGDSDWAINGAGFWFNHKYGAGLINASDAVRLAKNWSKLGTMTSVSVPLSSLPSTIRDNNSSGLVKYFDTRALSALRVEHATVTTDITHPSRGELEIQLTSPDGTTSRLAEKHTSYAADPADYPDWTFSTVHNWGEDSRGLWKLKIADRVSGNTGTLNSATLKLYGTAK